jgi:hypothetical protein
MMPGERRRARRTAAEHERCDRRLHFHVTRSPRQRGADLILKRYLREFAEPTGRLFF